MCSSRIMRDVFVTGRIDIILLCLIWNVWSDVQALKEVQLMAGLNFTPANCKRQLVSLLILCYRQAEQLPSKQAEWTGPLLPRTCTQENAQPVSTDRHWNKISLTAWIRWYSGLSLAWWLNWTQLCMYFGPDAWTQASTHKATSGETSPYI